MIKVVVIEDEDRIRRSIINLVSQTNEQCVVVGQAGTVDEALQVIEATQPDLLLLDIKLPDGTSFDILDQIKIEPQIIFITAFDEFAVRAFKFSATDYILKPMDPDDLSAALNKVTEPSEATSTGAQIEALKDNLSARVPTKILLKTREGVHVIRLHEIIYCGSDSGYTEFHLRDGRKILASKTLKEFMNTLSLDERFFRVHQSYTVNINDVKAVNNRGMIELSNGATVPVASRKKDLLIERLEAI